MASGDHNLLDDFNASDEAPDQSQARPTFFSLFSGYFGSLILILVLSAIIGLLLFFRLFVRHLYTNNIVSNSYWPFLDRSDYRSVSWGAVILIGGSLLYGIWVWFTGIFEEIRTRHDLERHARNSQINAGNTPLGRLLGQRKKD